MIVAYTKQFVSDVENYPLNKKRILEVIESLKKADSLSQIRNIKKLKAPGYNYRLRIGYFRIGFTVSDHKIILKRVLHRKDIYKFFPWFDFRK